MKVYLAHSGDVYDLIGVYQDKDMAIQAIEQSLTDVDMEYVEVKTKPNGNMFWTEHGMDIVTVGYLEVRELL